MSTPFRLLLPRQIYTEMVSQAQAELPNECCGLLAGRIEQSPEDPVARVVRCFPLENAAASPIEFLSEPKSMFAAERARRNAGLDFVAVYHSHPASRPVPSAIDLARSYSPEVINLIISLERPVPEMRGWWLSGDGYQEADVHIQ